MFYMLYDPTYILVIFAFILTLFASFGVKSTFARYSKVKSANGFTGSMAARRILDMRNRLNRILADNTGQPIDIIAKDTNRDNFMTADEALAFGLVDRVLDHH